MADESKQVVSEYIYEGDMYSIEDNGDVVGVALFTFPSSGTVELKNVALSPNCRGKGIGREALNQFFSLYQEKQYEWMIVGTANSSIGNFAFYQKAGFRFSTIKRGFFNKYDEMIYENGIQAVDMIMFEMKLA
ncbi:GNAT family N-acetyltransferase [Salicibibacter cibarius]|uniref:GNAT family N-acetyltransferase n=2 Tax=Salicibibacter cibarius TaxID=2743000 RepID=A0A7T6Z7B9_9BACI|nr:GNAT family N-acetyltransferase [Salicibibacter cibarius]